MYSAKWSATESLNGPHPAVSADLRLVFPAAGAMADPDEDQVALADAVGLGRLRRAQVIGGHMIARLQPGHPAHPRDVEQQAAAGDPLAGDVDGELGRSGGGGSGIRRPDRPARRNGAAGVDRL